MIIGGLQKFTLSDFPGIPAGIIFTQGCNFRCPFCHNGELLPTTTKNEICGEYLFDWLKNRKGKLGGIVISGGEPTIHHDLIEFIQEVREIGYKIKLDTNGSNPEMLHTIIEQDLVDFIAMDIKAPFKKYNLLSGRKIKTQAIESSINVIAKSSIDHLFRTTVVDSMLSPDDLMKIRQLVPGGSQYITQEFKKEFARDPTLS